MIRDTWAGGMSRKKSQGLLQGIEPCSSVRLQVVMASALVVGAGVASATLWYYCRRYVGELALLPSAAPGQPPRVRLSVLDFWGNREVRGTAGGKGARQPRQHAEPGRGALSPGKHSTRHACISIPTASCPQSSCAGQRRGAAGAGASAGQSA